jgi:hypothetical protein
MDPVHRSMDLYHGIFFRKIILKILEIPIPQKFYKNTPKLFLNYVLVLVILHLGPYLTFYNYN